MALGVQIFHAGTESSSTGQLRTAGGRVLSVAAHGSSLQDAVSRAYEGVKSAQFEGMVYRRDIASRYESTRIIPGRILCFFLLTRSGVC